MLLGKVGRSKTCTHSSVAEIFGLRLLETSTWHTLSLLVWQWRSVPTNPGQLCQRMSVCDTVNQLFLLRQVFSQQQEEYPEARGHDEKVSFTSFKEQLLQSKCLDWL